MLLVMVGCETPSLRAAARMCRLQHREEVLIWVRRQGDSSLAIKVKLFPSYAWRRGACFTYIRAPEDLTWAVKETSDDQ